MQHRYLRLLGMISAVVLAAGATSQPQGIDNSSVGNVHVHVVYPDDRGAGLHLRVQLMGGGSTPVSESFTDDRGRAEFIHVPIGEYHVLVTGEGVEETDSGSFEIDRRKTSQDVFITVRSSESKSNRGVHGPGSVAAADLKVPSDAQKAFDEASKAMAAKEWEKAILGLKRAVAIYPQYASAYNNLGVAFGRMNDPAHEREALEKAISLNDRFAPAFVNLAKLCLREHDALRAESLLAGALRAEPNQAETMTLLAEAQLLNKDYDAAIASAKSVHAIPHQGFGVVHYIAGRALERENRPQAAVVELQIFLTEEPTGARADHVREEIAQLLKRAQP